MVKGISRQVLVVHAPEQKLFEEAIFILKDDAVGKEGITDEMLLKSADKLLRGSAPEKKRSLVSYGFVWACVGALITGLIWLLSALV